jgi:LemA protein
MNHFYLAAGASSLIALIVAVIYNSLVGKKNQVENAFSGIDVQLKKRYDLIPNLISSVKEYLEHEKSLLTEITQLRSQAMRTNLSTEDRVQLDNQISKTISGIKVAAENYPELKAHSSFLSLNGSLNEVEGQLAAARRAYNASVMEFNDALQMFPSNIVAGMMKFKKKQTFEALEIEKENINVKNLFES